MDFLEGLDYGQLHSFLPGDRSDLFNQMVARTSSGSGGLAPFVQAAAGRLRRPLDILFNLGEQFPLSGTEDMDPSKAPDFSKFLGDFGGIPGGGAFRNVIDKITALQGRPASANYDNPFAQGAPDYFNQNPQRAFDLGFGAQGISPFNPFQKFFEDTARRRFNAAVGPGNEAYGYLRNQNQFLQGLPA